MIDNTSFLLGRLLGDLIRDESNYTHIATRIYDDLFQKSISGDCQISDDDLKALFKDDTEQKIESSVILEVGNQHQVRIHRACRSDFMFVSKSNFRTITTALNCIMFSLVPYTTYELFDKEDGFWDNLSRRMNSEITIESSNHLHEYTFDLESASSSTYSINLSIYENEIGVSLIKGSVRVVLALSFGELESVVEKFIDIEKQNSRD